MRKIFSSGIVFLLLLDIQGAYAQTASGDLARIEAETLVLKAREKQLEVQAKIIARQSEIATKQAESDRLVQAAVVGNPVVISIEGVGGKIFATLKMENGNTLDAQAGDFLENGMKVVSIKANEVIIESVKHKRVRLSMASHSANSFDASYPTAGAGLPPLAQPSYMPGH